MTCLLRPASCPRPCLIASASKLPRCKGPFLPPGVHRLPRPLPGVRMFEMARFKGRAPTEVGVSAEGDAMLGVEESPGARREAVPWSSVEAALNQMSKWLVAGCFSFAALWKHDVEIMWVLLGACANSLLSLILKKMLNHERPAPALRSDPGMPSSHAQSMFYGATVLVLSFFFWLRTNYPVMIIGSATLSAATYLSWLRVSQGLHTLNQVMVGAAVGSAFGALWFLLWHSFLQEAALASSPLLQNAVVLGSVLSCSGFIVYVIHEWKKDE